MLFHIELFLYIIYIYFLIFLFLFIKPTYFTVPLFFIYCFITTWYTLIGCKKKEINIYLIKFIMVFIYSIGGVIAYYFVHYYWHTLICKVVVLFSPIIYLLNVRCIEYFFICEKHLGINTLKRLLIFMLELIR